MGAPLLIAGAVIAGVSLLTGAIGGGIQAAENQKNANAATRREASRLKAAMKGLDDMLAQGKIDLNEYLGRVEEFAKGSSATFKAAINEATSKGIEAINLQQKAALDEIDTQLEFSKADASRAEEKEIERHQEQIGELRKNFDTTQEKARTSLSQRRLTGASAAAVLNKNNDTFNQAVGKAHELTGKLRSDISFGLNRAIDKTGLNRRMLANQTQANTLNFQGQQGSRLAQGLQNIESNRFQQSEAGRAGFQNFQRGIGSEKLQLSGAAAGLPEEKDASASDILSGALTGAAGGAQAGAGASSIFTGLNEGLK